MNWTQAFGGVNATYMVEVCWSLKASFIVCRVLHNQGGNLTTNSVSTPLYPVGNSTLYSYITPVYFPSIQRILNNAIVAENLLCPVYRSVLQVCFLYNARISEILNLTISSVLSADRVYCAGSKRSHGYIIYLPTIGEQISENGLVSASQKLFSPTYMQLYRAAVKVGLRIEVGENQNKKRLHASRYSIASEVSKKTITADLTGILHHRSSSSQQ